MGDARRFGERKSWALVLAGLLALLAAQGCVFNKDKVKPTSVAPDAVGEPDSPHVEAAPQDLVHRATLGPGDVFLVQVFKETELSGEYRVNNDGNVQMPLIGEIAVSGIGLGHAVENQ